MHPDLISICFLRAVQRSSRRCVGLVRSLGVEQHNDGRHREPPAGERIFPGRWRPANADLSLRAYDHCRWRCVIARGRVPCGRFNALFALQLQRWLGWRVARRKMLPVPARCQEARSRSVRGSLMYFGLPFGAAFFCGHDEPRIVQTCSPTPWQNSGDNRHDRYGSDIRQDITGDLAANQLSPITCKQILFPQSGPAKDMMSSGCSMAFARFLTS